MATSDVDIANIALTSLGEPPITSLSGTDKAARLCSLMLPYAKDEVTAAHEWSFAVARKEIVQIAEAANLTDYRYVYSLPDDTLRVLGVRVMPGESGSAAPPSAATYYAYGRRVLDAWDDDPEYTQDYIIEEGNLYTNVADAYLKYIKRVTNPSLFPTFVVEAIAMNLAKRISFSLVQNTQVWQAAQQAFYTAVAQAIQADSRQQKAKPQPPTQWTEVL